ncbi:MAG TPA: RDD family protein [Acidobacteriota bacterium]|nr:RDD family protein [Acidobacteriota bacterium]HQM62013.1 RDD family protein [Acidobacteriota bacterium]
MICPFCLKDFPAGYSQCPHCLGSMAGNPQPAYAGVFRRFFAFFFDVLIISVPATGLYFGLIFALGPDQPMIPLTAMSAVLGLLGILQLVLLLTSGQTIGKKMLGAKIVGKDFEKAGVGKILLREIIGRMVCGLTASIGYLIILFNPQRRGLHDMIGGTVVLRKQKAAETPAAAAPTPQPAFEAAPAPPPPTPAAPTAVPIAAPPTPEPAFQPPPPLPAEPPAPVMVSPAMPVAAPPVPPVPQPVKMPEAAAAAVVEAGSCPACHSPIEDPSSKFCLVCGYPIQGGIKIYNQFCPNCKAPVPEGTPTCPSCNRLMAEVPPPVVAPFPHEAAAEATVVVSAPQIISYTAEGRQEVFTLQIPLTKIGRNKDNHIPLPGEKAISGHHCEIYMEGTQFFIRDLKSTNGVYVNNKKVETSVLADGDKIKLGFKIFRFKQS